MKTIQRYTDGERTGHWAMAMLFFLAALSGFAFFHPALYFFVNLFGGGPWARILHPFLGVAMLVILVYMALQVWSHNKLDDNDRKWLSQWRDVVANHEDKVPEVGRYNAGQKVIFWILIVCVATLLVTGILFWRSVFGDFPADVVRIAVLLHALAATVLVISIIVHIYSAIWVKGSVRGILRGDVSEAWAKRHHLAWYREVSGKR